MPVAGVVHHINRVTLTARRELPFFPDQRTSPIRCVRSEKCRRGVDALLLAPTAQFDECRIKLVRRRNVLAKGLNSKSFCGRRCFIEEPRSGGTEGRYDQHAYSLQAWHDFPKQLDLLRAQLNDEIGQARDVAAG